MVYVNEGAAQISINDKKFELHTDECIFIHSNDIHNILSDEQTTITVLKADREHFEGLFASRRLLLPTVDKSLNANMLLTEVKTELTSGLEGSGTLADCLVSIFFVKLLRLSQTVPSENRAAEDYGANRLYNEISHLISNEYSTITFESAAKRLHFSESYFSKLFRSLFGMTFTQYLNTVRIAASIEMLRKGGTTITKISDACGFNTIRNFNRVFKCFTGYSPNSLPSDYVYMYNLKRGRGLDPTLNCTAILE